MEDPARRAYRAGQPLRADAEGRGDRDARHLPAPDQAGARRGDRQRLSGGGRVAPHPTLSQGERAFFFSLSLWERVGVRATREGIMALNGLNHVSTRPSDLEATKDFYVDVLELEVGPRPTLPFPGYWLYCGKQAVIHLIGTELGGAGEAPPTGR